MDGTYEIEDVREVTRAEVKGAYQDLMSDLDNLDGKLREMVDLLDAGPDVSDYTGYNRQGISKRISKIHAIIADLAACQGN